MQDVKGLPGQSLCLLGILRRFLHGAACHGCLLIAETSCEQKNDFLDRALVVRTVDNLGVEFFEATKP